MLYELEAGRSSDGSSMPQGNRFGHSIKTHNFLNGFYKFSLVLLSISLHLLCDQKLDKRKNGLLSTELEERETNKPILGVFKLCIKNLTFFSNSDVLLLIAKELR
jgi:hypothetical protein